MKKWGFSNCQRKTISPSSFLQWFMLLGAPWTLFLLMAFTRHPAERTSTWLFNSLSLYTNIADHHDVERVEITKESTDDIIVVPATKITKESTDNIIVPATKISKESTDNIIVPAMEIIKEPVIKNYSRLEKIEAVLAKLRHSIKEASKHRGIKSIQDDPDYVPQGSIYRNPNAFHRSFLEMEKNFRIYVYKEGIPPLFHTAFLKTVYSTEGIFMHEMKKGNLYQTTNSEDALAYFLPFSVVRLVQYLHKPRNHRIPEIGLVVTDYVTNVISHKYPYWNQSRGADHLMVACHDWGPQTTWFVPELMNNSIRVLCNANTSEGFNPSKDATLPEINLKTGKLQGLIDSHKPPLNRTVLAFFAGRLHGDIRSRLLDFWKGKDEDILVYDDLPHGVSYDLMFRRSKFCLCPSGYEVASPRVVEAIYAECVPVLISDGYVPPFSDILNWKVFSISIGSKDIPNIKKILAGISQEQYLRMKRRVQEVRRHFVVNVPPKRYDVFHMTIHSIWLRRLNIQIL